MGIRRLPIDVRKHIQTCVFSGLNKADTVALVREMWDAKAVFYKSIVYWHDQISNGRTDLKTQDLNAINTKAREDRLAGKKTI